MWKIVEINFEGILPSFDKLRYANLNKVADKLYVCRFGREKQMNWIVVDQEIKNVLQLLLNVEF